MNYATQTLIHRYAKAYLHVFNTHVTSEDIDTIKNAYPLLNAHKNHFYYLSLVSIPDDTKIELLQKICTTFQLPASLYTLLPLLVTHKRSALFPDLCKQIVTSYNKLHQRMEFTISSAVAIDQKEKTTLEQYINQTLGDAQYNYVIDSKLIAGIKIVSDTLLWEQSIAKSMRVIRQALLPYSKG